MSSCVLIVDDDAGCGKVLALLVRQLGYQAAYVESGDKALDYLNEHRPDLVILDVMMPGIDGPEVLRRMRQNPQTAAVPVVMFSALADPQITSVCLSHGANEYWIKASLNFRDLEQRLEPYLRTAAPPN